MSTPNSSTPGSGSSNNFGYGQSGSNAASASAALAAATKDKKPTLAGVKTKQRKGVAKAQAKHEPTVFRDELLRLLSTCPSSTDWEGYLRILESAANELDVRKYDSAFFELLILGKLLAPGGAVLADGAEASPFSVLGRDLNQQKDVAAVFAKLIRRYKYLQKPLEENVLPGLIQNANRLDQTATPAGASLSVPGSAGKVGGASTPGNGSISGAITPTGSGTPLSGPIPAGPKPNAEKLATFLAHAISAGFTIPAVLANAKREHLVKDGTALVFLTTYCKTYMAPAAAGGAGEGLDQLVSSLRKGGAGNLLDFFPLQHRSMAHLQKEFKDKNLDKLTVWYNKVSEGMRRDGVFEGIKELIASGEGEDVVHSEEIISYIDSVQKSTSPLNEQDLVTVLWQAIMSHDLDINNTNKDQVADRVLKWIKSTDPVLEKYTQGARAEIALINAIQVYFYENPPLIPLFPRVLQLLYNDDVLSSSGIFYWFEKGAKPNGKQTFLKSTEALVKAIRQSEDDDDEDEE